MTDHDIVAWLTMREMELQALGALDTARMLRRAAFEIEDLRAKVRELEAARDSLTYGP